VRLACLAGLILAGAFWASPTAAPASEVVTRPPEVAATTWRLVIARTPHSPARGPVIESHSVGLFMEAGYCLGGPKPEYDHVTLVELPKTRIRPFRAAVVTAYIRWPEYSYTPSPGPPEYGGKCLPVRRTIFKRVHTKRPASSLRLYDGYFSPPHQVWPHVPK
jgi:hypothetical protein